MKTARRTTIIINSCAIMIHILKCDKNYTLYSLINNIVMLQFVCHCFWYLLLFDNVFVINGIPKCDTGKLALQTISNFIIVALN